MHFECVRGASHTQNVVLPGFSDKFLSVFNSDQEEFMKVLTICLAILAIIITIVPQFSDCESQGRMLTLADGRLVSMKCHWTASAEFALGIPLFAVAGALFLSRQKETHIILGSLGMILGILVILIPTELIGVCASPDMLCHSVMRPVLILTGSLVTVISLAVTIYSSMKGKTASTA
jgi:hypothetical protein